MENQGSGNKKATWDTGTLKRALPDATKEEALRHSNASENSIEQHEEAWADKAALKERRKPGQPLYESQEDPLAWMNRK